MFFLNDTNRKGSRKDVDLLKLWKEDKAQRFGSDKAAYVENRDQLLNVDPSKTDYLLGSNHLLFIIFTTITYHVPSPYKTMATTIPLSSITLAI